MFIDKKRFISFTLSLVLLSILVNYIPLIQPLKYILFIFFLFFLIILPNKKKFFSLKFYLSLIIFLTVIIFINTFPLTFKFKISSFDNINYENIQKDTIYFYKDEFKFCFDNNSSCYRPFESKYKISNTFDRNYLNISNLNELRSNLFHSNIGSMQYENKFVSKLNYPFVLNLYFPELYFGSEICYQDLNKKIICELITPKKNQFEIFGKGEKNNVNLKQKPLLIIIKSLLTLIIISLYILILKQIYVFKIRNIYEFSYPFSLILILTIISFTNIENINFLNSYFYQYPGGDGHLYLIWGNMMSASLKNFDFIDFLRGASDTFYFMPGMRYFIALEKIIYGNAYYLHLIILSLLPFIIQNFLKFYFSKKIVFVLMFSFLFFPLMHHMGFSYFQFFRYFTKVFAEPIAYTIFLFGFIRLLNYFQNKDNLYTTLPLTCFVFIISCLLRPNLTSSSFFLLLLPIYDLIMNKRYKILILYTFVGSLIFLPLLHNIYFGNEFILFTSAVFSNANIKISIIDYINLLLYLEINDEKFLMMIEMLKNFFNPFEIHKYFILLVLFLSLKIKNIKNPKLYPLYILIFSQFYLFFFLNPGPRYIWIFWIASLILSLKIFIDYRKKNI